MVGRRPAPYLNTTNETFIAESHSTSPNSALLQPDMEESDDSSTSSSGSHTFDSVVEKMEYSERARSALFKALATAENLAENLLGLSQRPCEEFFVLSPASEWEPRRDLANTPSYEYTPLREGQIRVLELQYDTEDEIISCKGRIVSDLALTLLRVEEAIEALLLSLPVEEHSNLLETPALQSVRRRITELDINYDAPSYTWEGQIPERPILIDNKVMLITPNLESALKAIRKDISRDYPNQEISRPIRRIWIDSICINQNDVIEKQVQVEMMMRDIYALASGLDIWLGSNEGGCDAATQAFLSNALEKLRTVPNLTRGRNGNSKVKGFQEFFDIDDGNKVDGFDSIVRLLSSPWFFRTWVIQEYAVGLPRQRRIFRYGSLRIHGNEMESLAQFIKEIFRSSLEEAPLEQRINFLTAKIRLQELSFARFAHRAERVKNIRTFNGLLYWVELNRRTLATDPRDKIYAFLGIIRALQNADEDVFEGLLIDYNASIQDVFSSFVKYVVVSTRKLDILSANTGRGPLVDRTWTPDWTASGGDTLIEPIDRVDNPSDFNTSGDSQCVVSFPHKFDVLRARGFTWDEIILQSKFKSSDDLWAICSELSRIFMRSITRPFPVMYGHRSKNDMKRALWTTLLFTPNENRRSHIDLSCLGTPSQQNVQQPNFQEEADDPASWMCREMIRELDTFDEDESHSIIVTANGFVGKILYSDTQEGDIVVVLLGCSFPVILSPVENYFEYVGELYMDGIMNGEAMRAIEQGNIELRDFDLY